MKKSEAMHLAQIAVINAASISPEAKVDILWYLMDDERVAAFCEQQEAAKEAAE